eukprot:scaffold89827_cov54-Phaeocystis_antarctica.AAC.3
MLLSLSSDTSWPRSSSSSSCSCLWCHGTRYVRHGRGWYAYGVRTAVLAPGASCPVPLPVRTVRRPRGARVSLGSCRCVSSVCPTLSASTPPPGLHAQKAATSAALEAAGSSTRGNSWAFEAARRAPRRRRSRAGALPRGHFDHAVAQQQGLPRAGHPRGRTPTDARARTEGGGGGHRGGGGARRDGARPGRDGSSAHPGGGATPAGLHASVAVREAGGLVGSQRRRALHVLHELRAELLLHPARRVQPARQLAVGLLAAQRRVVAQP